MTLVEAYPSDEMRVILCLKFDRRARFDAVTAFKTELIGCSCVVHSVESSGAFDFMIEAALPDFPAYHMLLDQFAEPLAALVDRHEASFVCRRFMRAPPDRTPVIWVPCRDGRRRIDTNSIDLIHAEGDYVRLHCGADSWLLHDTMRHFRGLLDDRQFLTLHRSAIVNVDFIARLHHRRSYWVAVLADGTEQRIAKSHVVPVLSALRTDSSSSGGDLATESPPTESAQLSMENPLHRDRIPAISGMPIGRG